MPRYVLLPCAALTAVLVLASPAPGQMAAASDDPVVVGSGTHTDFREPGVLVYLPSGDGDLELVAVENPETEALEAHGFAPHYELHVWVHRENPAGVFAQFHPDLRCPETAAGAHETTTGTAAH